MRTKIYVAGSATFLGKRVVNVLKKYERTYALVPEGATDTPKSAARTLSKAKPDMVVNCGMDTGGIAYVAKNPGDLFYRNTLAHLSLQEAARLAGVKKNVVILSNSTYPSTHTGKLKEKDWWSGPMAQSASSIGGSGKAAWLQSLAYQQQYGSSYTHLIVSNLYGPDDYFDETKSYAAGALIDRIIRARREHKKSVTIWGTGRAVRDWLYVDDAAIAIMKSLKKNTGLEPINIGTGVGHSIASLAKCIQTTVGYTGELHYDLTKPDGAPRKIMDNTRCANMLGWKPSTDLARGINKTVSWYEQYMPLQRTP